ncbi:hypothetical protein LLT5_02760 [Lactococcus cremoris subsp. cremoris TIFN5]|nr:hypothetical protein LLT5_02760 [Lactococcus cremoris subsp. cremoris TIFN5]
MRNTKEKILTATEQLIYKKVIQGLLLMIF